LLAAGLTSQRLEERRILAWSYDSSVAEISTFSSHKSIFGHADSLLGDLVRMRRGGEVRGQKSLVSLEWTES
jgi:hypothetical protein